MSTLTLETLLARPGFVVMDGGMGTSIEDAGISVANPLWGSAALLFEDARATNTLIHEDFLTAGAELLIANTHNASLAACARYLRDGFEASPGFEKPEILMAVVNALGVESARRAVLARAPAPPKERVNGHAFLAEGNVAVAGCIGSVEAPYATASKIKASEVVERARPQATVLARLPIDLLMFEMISTASEVVGISAIIEELSREHPDLLVGVGFTCGERGTTHGGVSMRDAVDAFRGAPPRLYSVQCTRFDLVERPLVELVDAVGDPRKVGVYANDGRVWNMERREWEGARVSPEDYARHARRWAELGVAVIGGCCGTKPEHVAAIARLRAKS